MALLILRMERRSKEFHRVARAVAASGRGSDETRACRDFRDEHLAETGELGVGQEPIPLAPEVRQDGLAGVHRSPRAPPCRSP